MSRCMKSTETNHVTVAAAVRSDCHQPLSWNGQPLIDEGDAASFLCAQKHKEKKQ